MSLFTCITCRVAFADADLQRSHYKTDWHRYNLKRKVAELPHVTAENFQQRVLAQRAQAADTDKDTKTYCNLCNKNFNTLNSYENHVQSKKHKEAELKEEQKLQAQVRKRNEKNEQKGLEVLDENEKVALKNAKNVALKESLQREESRTASETANTGTSSREGADSAKGRQGGARPHIEPMENDSDAESVESWEGDALGLEECLFCSNVSSSLEENIQHMTIIHSFFIPDIEYISDLEGLVTYLGRKVGEGYVCLWCNERGRAFHNTQAVQKHMVDKGHCKMLHEGDAIFEYVDFYDYRSSYPDHQQEEGAAGGAEPMEEDEEDPTPEVLEMDGQSYELVLPSGSAVGHRSLMRYYRQKLKPTRVLTYRPVSNIITQYKALGWTGIKGPEAVKRAKDVAFVQRMKARHFTKLGIKNNKMQPHFRPQVIF